MQTILLWMVSAVGVFLRKKNSKSSIKSRMCAELKMLADYFGVLKKILLLLVARQNPVLTNLI